MRVFVGCKFDSNAFKKITAYINNLSANGFRGNFTRKENLHLTLLFLGELSEELVKKVTEKLNEINFSSFEIKISKIKKLKDMVILEVDKNNELIELQKQIVLKMKELKINFDEKQYYPHVTIIRENYLDINKDIEINSNIKSFILFSSNRINGNLVYQNIYERSLEDGKS